MDTVSTGGPQGGRDLRTGLWKTVTQLSTVLFKHNCHSPLDRDWNKAQASVGKKAPGQSPDVAPKK